MVLLLFFFVLFFLLLLLVLLMVLLLVLLVLLIAFLVLLLVSLVQMQVFTFKKKEINSNKNSYIKLKCKQKHTMETLKCG